MNWIKIPGDEGVRTSNFCIIRVCSGKGYCDAYNCIALYCGKNNQLIKIDYVLKFVWIPCNFI